MGCFVVGLTGQTGAGKSTVSRVLEECGIPVIDCDLLARQAVLPGSDCLAQLAQAFGEQILLADGTLDRAKTASIAFSDPEKLQTLNQITHKAILALLDHQLQQMQQHGETLAVVDAPTLFESGADRFCQAVISVIAPQPLRYQRILARDGLDPEAARKRMGAQKEDSFYTSRSDYILENTGSREELEEKAKQLAQILKKKVGE